VARPDVESLHGVSIVSHFSTKAQGVRGVSGDQKFFAKSRVKVTVTHARVLVGEQTRVGATIEAIEAAGAALTQRDQLAPLIAHAGVAAHRCVARIGFEQDVLAVADEESRARVALSFAPDALAAVGVALAVAIGQGRLDQKALRVPGVFSGLTVLHLLQHTPIGIILQRVLAHHTVSPIARLLAQQLIGRVVNVGRS